jgi:hypothetical protein
MHTETSYEAFNAYLCGTRSSSVAATRDRSVSYSKIIPVQCGVSSEELHTGHTLPNVNALHFLHASSLGITYETLAFFPLSVQLTESAAIFLSLALSTPMHLRMAVYRLCLSCPLLLLYLGLPLLFFLAPSIQS